MSNRKLLYLASSPTQANLITSYLEGHNIRVQLEHLTMASILPIGANLSIRIFVFSPQWSRAISLLATFLEQETRDN